MLIATSLATFRKAYETVLFQRACGKEYTLWLCSYITSLESNETVRLLCLHLQGRLDNPSWKHVVLKLSSSKWAALSYFMKRKNPWDQVTLSHICQLPGESVRETCIFNHYCTNQMSYWPTVNLEILFIYTLYWHPLVAPLRFCFCCLLRVIQSSITCIWINNVCLFSPLVRSYESTKLLPQLLHKRLCYCSEYNNYSN